VAAQHRARGHGQCACKACCNSDGIQSSARCQHQQSDTNQAGKSRQHGSGGDPSSHDHAGQTDDNERLNGAHGRGHTTGQAIGGDEEHRPEEGEVQRAQHRHPPPPVAVWQGSNDEKQQEPGRQRAQHRHVKRISGGQEFGRGHIGRAPDGWRKCGQRECPSFRINLHIKYLYIKRQGR